jgi:MOSC domain-containing protein YiiM
MAMTDSGRVISVRVGLVRTHAMPEWDHSEKRTWQTAYQKDEVAGPVQAGRLGLAGDAVYSTQVHGGVHMAVLMYAASHYPAWREELGRGDTGPDAFGPGAFGENLCVEHFDEANVCIGDEFTLGDVRLQVSQPRGPCSNISRYWGIPTLLKRVSETHRTGWYLRVIQDGTITSGQMLTRVAQPHPEWNVRRVSMAAAAPESDAQFVRELANSEVLSPRWRESFVAKAARLA